MVKEQGKLGGQELDGQELEGRQVEGRQVEGRQVEGRQVEGLQISTERQLGTNSHSLATPFGYNDICRGVTTFLGIFSYVSDHHVRPFSRETLGDGATDTRRSACYDGEFIFEALGSRQGLTPNRDACQPNGGRCHYALLSKPDRAS